MEMLIVEDDLASRSLLREQLLQMGHQVHEAESGEQAWRLLQTKPIRFVIADRRTPPMGGIELCRKIRGGRFGRFIYTMVMSGTDRHADVSELFDCGTDDYITRPFDSDDFRVRIRAGVRIIDLEERCSAMGQRLADASENAEKSRALMLHSEKMAAIGELAAGVAHEINNPTGFIRSNLKTLQRYQRDILSMISRYRDFMEMAHDITGGRFNAGEAGRAANEIERMEEQLDLDFLMEDMIELVDDCNEGADRIKRIVLDLKRFAHPGDDTMQFIDINAGLESTLNVVHNQLKYRATVEKVFGQIPAVKGCAQQLNQVFMNILINAAQAMEKRGSIRVETRAVEADGMVEAVFSDDGSGIAPEHLTKIFDPFFTTKAVGKGTGLGMNIAFDIIKRHNGTIDVESEVGAGTTFTVRLPVDGIEGAASDPE